MKTNFAYIDDVLDRAIEAQHAAPSLPQKDQDEAAKKGRKLIGGFRVRDEAEERKALDGIIASRRAQIEKFRTDRKAIRDTLANLGVTPLAVCPTGAWYKICRETGLIVLSPDKQGRVGISPQFAKDFTGKSAEKNLDRYAETNWPDMLKRMFPDGLSLASSTHNATLVLPDPPADVAGVLCKAQSLKLTVAAVTDAIRFAEKPSELMKANAHPKDRWAQEQGYEDYADWLKRDPIIFTEHGSAAAIIAQFGDFPIEKEVVDAATSADDLIAGRPRPIERLESALWISTDEMYLRAMSQQMQNVELQRQWRRELEMRYLTQVPRAIMDSGNWTGSRSGANW